MFNRFYMRHPFSPEYEYHMISATILFMCGKIGDGRDYIRIEKIVQFCASDSLKFPIEQPVTRSVGAALAPSDNLRNMACGTS